MAEERDDFAEAVWHAVREAGRRLGLYADVQRAISVFGEDAAERLANFHVERAKADGVLRVAR